jgi:hypothetical protein
MKKPLALATLLCLLSACSSGTLPDYNILGALRVISIQASPPEVDPSSSPSVTITPVVSDLNQGRALSYTATGCIDPGVGYGAQPSCTGVPGAVSLGSGTIPPANLDQANHTNTGTAPTFSVTIPSTILATAPATTAFNGVAYLVVYTLIAANTDGSTSQVVSFKRVIASSAAKTPKNTNPTITGVNAGAQTLHAFINGLTFPLAGGTTTMMGPAFSADSVESYQQQNNDGSFSTLTETLTTTWFVSDGTTTFYRTTGLDTDTWTLPTAQPATASGTARTPVVVVVTRDGRGGESFMQVDPSP